PAIVDQPRDLVGTELVSASSAPALSRVVVPSSPSEVSGAVLERRPGKTGNRPGFTALDPVPAYAVPGKRPNGQVVGEPEPRGRSGAFAAPAHRQSTDAVLPGVGREEPVGPHRGAAAKARAPYTITPLAQADDELTARQG